MSIALMTQAWKSKFGSTAKMVLLALCDNANDQGECFPSVSMLAEKCSLSERAVFKQLDMLEESGAIKRNGRTGRSTIYMLNPCTWFTPAPDAPLNDVHTTPERGSPTPLNVVHPTPERGSPITISNHQIELSSNQKKTALLAQLPASLVSDFLEIRKAKKSPLTQTAVDGIQREAEKAGISLEDAIRACCEFGWAGFNAGWFADRQGKAKQSAEPAWRTEQRNRTISAVPAIAQVGVSPIEFFDVEAKNVTAITLGR
jgi:DNA-binding transcriptional regulator YhcF (GntR family)